MRNFFLKDISDATIFRSFLHLVPWYGNGCDILVVEMNGIAFYSERKRASVDALKRDRKVTRTA